MYCSQYGISKVLAENSPGNDCSAKTALMPLITSNALGDRTSPSKGPDLGITAIIQLEQNKNCLTTEEFLLKLSKNPDQTAQATVPSSAVFNPPRCPWMLKCPPVFPSH